MGLQPHLILRMLYRILVFTVVLLSQSVLSSSSATVVVYTAEPLLANPPN